MCGGALGTPWMRGCGEGVGAEQRERPHTYTHMVAVEVCVGWAGPGREVWQGKMYGSRVEMTLEDVETVSRHGLSLMVLNSMREFQDFTILSRLTSSSSRFEDF